MLSLAFVVPALADGGYGNGQTTGAAGGADSATGTGGAGVAGVVDHSLTSGGGGGGAGVTGGAGGAGFVNGGNGAGGAGGATAGADGSNGGDATDGANGGGGGGGGAHGAVVTTSGALSSVSGGDGGKGGNGPPALDNGGYIGGGGGGGAGGYGTVVDGSGLMITSNGTVSGGSGGNGGNGGGGALGGGGAGGDGGSGGIGLDFTGTSNSLTNSGAISGGNGGAGGAIYNTWDGERAGNGGAGGAGVVGSGMTITNTGTISGGNGGAAGSGGGGTAGAGGTGIVGSDLTVITSGTISGGLSGNGTTRANAITFTGGTNMLELQAGTSIIGNVVAYSSADTLTLGGSTDASFNLSGIGSQYLGFGIISKTGSSTWTVSGTNSTAVSWSVAGGTLQVASGATLGLASSSLSISGSAVLDLGGTTQTLNGGVTLADGTIQNGTLSSSGTFALQSGTVSAVLAGSGGVSKSGSGTVTLSGANSYTGGTTLSDGTLQVTGSGTLGAISNTLAVSGGILDLGATTQIQNGGVTLTGGTIRNGTLWSSATFALQNGSVSASLAGSGGVSKSGGGTVTLSNSNSYTGGTTVSDGTLQVTGAGTLGSGGNALTVSGGILDLGGTSQTQNGGVTLSGGTIQTGTLWSSATFALQSGMVNAVLAGNGGVSKSGSGTVTLSGANSYSGGTIVSDGTLQVAGVGTLGAISNALTVSGGTLDLGGTMQTQNGGLTLTGGGTIQTGTLWSSATFDLWSGTVSASLAGAGGVSKSGSGTVTLSGVNGYTGGTVVSDGTLQVTGAGTLGAISNTLAVSGGTLDLGGTTQTQNGGVTLTGGTIQNGSLSSNATFALQSGTVSASLSGTGGVNKTGSGTVTLAGANDYTGGTVVAEGALQLSGGGTLGATGNSVTVSGGTLNLGGTTQIQNGGVTLTSGAISGGTLASSGVFDLQSGLVAADLAGTGTVIKSGNGTVVLMLPTSYTGGTVVAEGTLRLGSAGSLGADSNGLTVSGGTLDLGGNALAQNGGVTLTGGTIQGGELSSSATFDLQSGTISAALAGAGSVSKTGSGRVVLSGANSYTGTTTIDGGTLQVDGSIASSRLTTIDAGGTLTGIGTVGNLLVASGGTFAPGSGSTGTSMTVAGNLAFQSGAIYLVQIDPTTSSSATVTGTATLGGATVAASFASGSYIEKRYTILTAGSISGSFASSVATTSLPSTFTTSLSYDATNVYLDLSLAFVAPSGTSFSANQQGVGTAIVNYFNSNGRIPRAFGGLTAAGLTQLSGEHGTSAQSTSIGAMGQFAGTLMDTNAAGRMGSSGGPGALGYAEETPSRKGDARDAMASIAKAPPATSFVQRWAVWASGFGGGQSTDGNAAAGSSNTTSRIYGTAVGLDYQLTPNTIAGFALAGGGTNFNTGTLGSGRSDLFQAGAFIRHSIGPAYLSAALAYGWQDVTTERTLTVSGVDRLQAKFKTNTWSGRLEGGTRVAVPWLGGFGATPYAAAQFTRLDLPDYAEKVLSGSSTFALSYDAQKVMNTRTELGLRTDKSFAVADGIFTLRGRAAWAHDFNPNRTVAATFQSLPGASFVVNGAGQAKDAALTTVAAEMAWLNGWSTSATFDGEFSNVSRSYMGKGTVRYAW